MFLLRKYFFNYLFRSTNVKSIYLEFNPPIHDVKGKSVRYECLNLEIYTNPETCQQLKQNKAVEEVAETIRCERYLQLVRSDYSFLAKARLDEDFLEYFMQNGDCHHLWTRRAKIHSEAHRAHPVRCSLYQSSASGRQAEQRCWHPRHARRREPIRQNFLNMNIPNKSMRSLKRNERTMRFSGARISVNIYG